MSDAALSIYKSLDSTDKIQEMINNGESEGLHLECKAPHKPQLDQELRSHLSVVLSGFSNTEGGVILYGVETNRHRHSKLDVLTEVVPVGNCAGFAGQISAKIPSLTTPPITNAKVKILKSDPAHTKGLVVVCVSKAMGDPIQTVANQHFYYHTGTSFERCPHEMIKRLFAATESPELVPAIDVRTIEKKDERGWEIPIVIHNLSSAIAEHTVISIEIQNSEEFESLKAKNIRDMSNVNPGACVFMAHPKQVMHKGLPTRIGSLILIPRPSETSSGRAELIIAVFANKMRASKWYLSVVLGKPPGIAVRGPEFI